MRRRASSSAPRTRPGAVPPGTSWLASTDSSFQGIEEIAIEFRAELPKLFQAQPFQFTFLLHRQAHPA